MKQDAEGSKDLSVVSAENWNFLRTQEGRGLTAVLSTGCFSF